MVSVAGRAIPPGRGRSKSCRDTRRMVRSGRGIPATQANHAFLHLTHASTAHPEIGAVETEPRPVADFREFFDI